MAEKADWLLVEETHGEKNADELPVEGKSDEEQHYYGSKDHFPQSRVIGLGNVGNCGHKR